AFPVGRLDMAGALDAFTARVRKELPAQAGWLNPHSILDDQLGSLAGKNLLLSPEALRGLRATMENGGASLRMVRNNLGPSKQGRLVVTLRRETSGGGTLRHDVKLTTAKTLLAAETLTEKVSSGSDGGYKVTETPTVDSTPNVKSAAAGFDDRAGTSRSTARATNATDMPTASIAWSGPAVRSRTRFTLSIDLELDGVRQLAFLSLIHTS
ncbi:hypothetical protein ADK38_16830, partial [Streptomyces varsoviensis]